ncbi:MAG: hypothetical protein IJ308_03210 [Clostridia bacterium]|nr:hypothetical protein [Clostridia bacterium]
MNLKKTEKNLTDLLNKKMGLEFTYKTEEGLLLANCNISLYGREKPITCNLWIFEAGSVLISFLCGEAPYTARVLDAASRFNSEVTFLKATVMSGVLNILHEAYVVEEKLLPAYVKGILGVLVSDEVKKNLEELLQACEETSLQS